MKVNYFVRYTITEGYGIGDGTVKFYSKEIED